MSYDLLQLLPEGLYCPAGGFYIDPWQPVSRAVITHAHADHLCWGCQSYLASAESEPLMRLRLGRSPSAGASLQCLPYGEAVTIGEVRVSLHPAGHVLGAAQVRIEHRGQVWVVSGDYKTEPDPTCAPFEVVRCHVFITESTFGLPVFRWPSQAAAFAEINDWWAQNAAQGRASVLFGYALGKAQRLLAGLDPSIGPIFTHGAVESVNQAYRAQRHLPPTRYVGEENDARAFKNALILAPPSANGTAWMRRFGDFSSAFASGWMQIRGARRRRAVDRGFVISDHADWPALVRVTRETAAERVWVTHGYNNAFARWLSEQGIAAQAVETRFQGERDDAAVEEEEIEG